jgi:hypothetical protein
VHRTSCRPIPTARDSTRPPSSHDTVPCTHIAPVMLQLLSATKMMTMMKQRQRLTVRRRQRVACRPPSQLADWTFLPRFCWICPPPAHRAMRWLVPHSLNHPHQPLFPQQPGFPTTLPLPQPGLTDPLPFIPGPTARLPFNAGTHFVRASSGSHGAHTRGLAPSSSTTAVASLFPDTSSFVGASSSIGVSGKRLFSSPTPTSLLHATGTNATLGSSPHLRSVLAGSAAPSPATFALMPHAPFTKYAATLQAHPGQLLNAAPHQFRAASDRPLRR